MDKQDKIYVAVPLIVYTGILSLAFILGLMIISTAPDWNNLSFFVGSFSLGCIVSAGIAFGFLGIILISEMYRRIGITIFILVLLPIIIYLLYFLALFHTNPPFFDFGGALGILIIDILVLLALGLWTILVLAKEQPRTIGWITILMVIIGILFLFMFLYAHYHPIGDRDTWCVSQPIDEIVTTIQQASSGITKVTSMLCLKKDESFDIAAIDRKLSELEVTSIKCSDNENENHVCREWSSQKLDVTDDRVTAIGGAQFKIRVNCDSPSYNVCHLTVINP